MKSIVDYLNEAVNEGKVTDISTTRVKGSKTMSMFKEFEMLRMNGVTVPEFDTVDTNLE